MTIGSSRGVESPRDRSALTVKVVRVTLTLSLLIATTAYAELPQMKEGSPFGLDVSSAAVHADSTLITTWLENAGGWGYGRFQIDFSIDVVDASPSDPTIDVTAGDGYYYGECDDPGASIPLPPGGTVEGNAGYECVNQGDCHLIVHDPAKSLLYEAFYASVSEDVLTATCFVEWQLLASYPPSGRGDGCTSADAAGFPIAPLLFDADEIASGSIDHAIRFILPNSRIRAGHYMHPASHYGGPSAPSDSDAPIYGMRFRLKSGFAIDGYSASAQVVLRALKKYGMFLADGGNIALTARSDRGTTNTWEGVGLGSRDIDDLVPSDFEVLNGHGPDPLQGPFAGWPDCVRNEIPEPHVVLGHALALACLAALAHRRGA